MSVFKKQPPELTPQGYKAAMTSRLNAMKAQRPIAQYVNRGPAGIEQVVCKICGNPVRKLVPDERFRETRVIGNREVTVERLVFMTLPNYQELALLFDDGSRHISVVCTECGPKLKLDDMEWIYCCDVQEMMSDAGAEGLNMRYYSHRVVVDFYLGTPGEVIV